MTEASCAFTDKGPAVPVRPGRPGVALLNANPFAAHAAVGRPPARRRPRRVLGTAVDLRTGVLGTAATLVLPVLLLLPLRGRTEPSP